MRITFNEPDRELALIAGLRPILQKGAVGGQRDLPKPNCMTFPIGTGPYVIDDYEAGRYVNLRRNPDYWGKDMPFRRGTMNLDEMRIEFYGDATVLFEAFKAGELSAVREFNADKWDTQYNFPAIQRGDVVKTEIPHGKPSGMTGFVMNTRKPPFDDWRVREALTLAFNFEFINDTITGGAQPRITSYFSGSDLAMQPGPATGKVKELLEPFACRPLLPGALEGYALPARRRLGPQSRATYPQSNPAAGRGRVDHSGRACCSNQNGEPFTDDGAAATGRQAEMKTADRNLCPRAGTAGHSGHYRTGRQRSIHEAAPSELDFDMTPFPPRPFTVAGQRTTLYWGSENADDAGHTQLDGGGSRLPWMA